MFEKLAITRMAQSLAAHSGARMGVIAANVANADTPGFKAQDIGDFASLWAAEGAAMRATRPGHLARPQAASMPARDGGGSEAPNGNSVSLEKEMVKMAEARQGHEMALAIYRSTSEVTRASLGRSR